jgi:hypothetical protein
MSRHFTIELEFEDEMDRTGLEIALEELFPDIKEIDVEEHA